MSFVPMHLRQSNTTAFQLNGSNPFKLAPSARTVVIPKTHNIADTASDGDGSHMRYCPYDLEIHRQS